MKKLKALFHIDEPGKWRLTLTNAKNLICTGFAMMAELHKRFGSRFTPAFVGANIEC